jgi:hypothetical protein
MMWWVFLVVLGGFSGFTVYCSLRENFWKSCAVVFGRLWGRQVTLDLYIGLFLFHYFVYVREGSWLVTALWLAPSLILGNIVPLIYLLTHV